MRNPLFFLTGIGYGPAMTTGTMRLEAMKLDCQRGGREVFSGLNFTLEPGEALIVTGPNGSGKSSLLRLIAGLLTPVAGSLHWQGQAAKSVEGWPGHYLHYAGHLMALKPALTVLENVRFWAEFYGRGAKAKGACITLGLENLLDFPVRYLSEGQKRRTALARLAAVPLPLWLLDEPTSGLDRETTERLETLMDRHLKEGGMVIAATHLPINIPGSRALALGEQS